MVGVKINKQDLNDFRKRLQKLRSEMLDEFRRITDDTLNKTSRESSGDLSGYSFHMADQASDNYDREFSLNLATNEQKTLYRIDAALKRIEDKTFGECESCSRKISKARLRAVPFAELCLACQKARESKRA